ncbi:Permease cytosine/purines uracil thiamine allantoin [Penicillium cf. griseofulvum]|uniref:Permease cytosine/purines uracil thiamine allantoin n=1 Tax=Penicillium cf. griseofulvum TaxID=2972120 RepID=A0A9W9JHK5_9EURO|nr:Permease cytosine/purines uracil thiamine allantoin [Penicillium cf. griseofulvum]
MKLRIPRPRLRVSQGESAFAAGNARWTNHDLDPIAKNARRWGVLSIIEPSAYWISDALQAATWQFASGMIAVGLTYREALGIVALSFFIISLVISANGAVGAIYHVPFPVIARASWGFWGSYIAIISRVILAVFWFAIQNVNGGNAVRVMLGAIWPSYLDIPNHIPESQGITTNGMVGLLLFWLLQVPFLCMHPDKLRWLFTVKSILVPISWLAILQILYIPMLPAVFTFFSFIGIAASSAGQIHYNLESIPWDPMVLISYWPNRACRFFGAASFVLAALGVNISANSLSAANDFNALAPRYINLRRGQLLCAVLSWCLVPWKILASAGNFLNFMSAYAVFLGPIAAIMMFDFWVVNRRRYDSLALYQPNNPTYRYTFTIPGFAKTISGTNWRAVVAFVVGVAPCIPGLIKSVNSHIDVGVGMHPFEFGWLLGFVATSIVYVLLSWLFPAKETQVDRAVLPDEIYDGGTVDGLESDDPDRKGVVTDTQEKDMDVEKAV